MRIRTTHLARFAALMVVALMATILDGPVAAQDANNFGNAATALGIGRDGDAFINLIHASPDAPAVDVYLDGTKTVENLAFGTSTGWVAVLAGEHNIQVTATGAAVDTAVIDANVTLAANAGYEIAALGLVANIRSSVVRVDFSAIEGDYARVQAIHASPDAGLVDVALKGGNVVIPNLSFTMASGYLEVPAGSYDLEIRPAGTTDVALPLDGLKFETGMIYGVYVIGLAGDSTLTVLVIESPAEVTPTDASGGSSIVRDNLECREVFGHTRCRYTGPRF